ncbi:hypothetical protein ACVIRO_001275 [Rhizobium ruizarguesonis]
MRVLSYATAIALTILLAGCVTGAVTSPGKDVREQLAPLCPVPLTQAQLDRDADLLSGHPELLPLGNDLFRLHQSAQLCRTGKL